MTTLLGVSVRKNRIPQAIVEEVQSQTDDTSCMLIPRPFDSHLRSTALVLCGSRIFVYTHPAFRMANEWESLFVNKRSNHLTTRLFVYMMSGAWDPYIDLLSRWFTTSPTTFFTSLESRLLGAGYDYPNPVVMCERLIELLSIPKVEAAIYRLGVLIRIFSLVRFPIFHFSYQCTLPMLEAMMDGNVELGLYYRQVLIPMALDRARGQGGRGQAPLPTVST